MSEHADSPRAAVDLGLEADGPVLLFAADVEAAAAACVAPWARAGERGRPSVVVLPGAEDGASAARLAALGASRVRFLASPEGRPEADERLVARLAALLAEHAPVTVVAVAGASQRARACALGLAAAARRGPERAFVLLEAGGGVRRVPSDRALELVRPARDPALPRTTAVVSTWNKKEDVRANVDALRAQTLPFDEIVVVDNASRDGTASMLAAEFPEVRRVVMPHDRYGACETFNIGFASVATELTAILDDDIVMPPDWLENTVLRLLREPATTAIVSTQVVEPGTPAAYLASPAFRAERYMSTFRGCASLARSDALRAAGYYDERLFIYGNERDLTCRLLNLGYRVLQYPGAHVFHKTPFGIKLGQRSLYFHARNAWLSMLKYAPLADLLRMPFLVVTRVLLRGRAREEEGAVTDATGTIGVGRALRETPGAWRVLIKAGASVLWNVPYCLRRRAPCRAPDFELPLS
ncbi:MAG: glycosyltransferase family 2 protein [Planctomycetes bacterium]|nr:glycosyltransferase family 2 protein [Planctomycetota bacterium]